LDPAPSCGTTSTDSERGLMNSASVLEIPLSEFEAPRISEQPLYQKTFKLTDEIRRAFTILDTLNGEIYAVGGAVISMIKCANEPEVASNADVDMVVFNLDVSMLAALKFYPSVYKPSLYKNKKLNIDLYVIQDESSDRLRSAMQARDFTICSLMCARDGVVSGLDESYFDDVANGRLRAIHSPQQCFAQDCIRLIRAIKFCLKGFHLDEAAAQAIHSWRVDFTSSEIFQISLKTNALLQHPEHQAMLVELLKEHDLLKKLFDIESSDPIKALHLLKLKVSALIARPYKVSKSSIFSVANAPSAGVAITVDALFSSAASSSATI
ncbi:MAG: hypothetical protein WA253_09395, partial [Gammaproteobacteria bacterium]